MKPDKSAIPAIIELSIVMFLIGVLVGGWLVNHDIKSNPEKYGIYAKDTKPECSCVCYGGLKQ